VSVSVRPHTPSRASRPCTRHLSPAAGASASSTRAVRDSGSTTATGVRGRGARGPSPPSATLQPPSSAPSAAFSAAAAAWQLSRGARLRVEQQVAGEEHTSRLGHRNQGKGFFAPQAAHRGAQARRELVGRGAGQLERDPLVRGRQRWACRCRPPVAGLLRQRVLQQRRKLRQQRRGGVVGAGQEGAKGGQVLVLLVLMRRSLSCSAAAAACTPCGCVLSPTRAHSLQLGIAAALAGSESAEGLKARTGTAPARQDATANEHSTRQQFAGSGHTRQACTRLVGITASACRCTAQTRYLTYFLPCAGPLKHCAQPGTCERASSNSSCRRSGLFSAPHTRETAWGCCSPARGVAWAAVL